MGEFGKTITEISIVMCKYDKVDVCMWLLVATLAATVWLATGGCMWLELI